MNAGSRTRVESRITLVQGECRISDDPAIMLSTLLGSCVSMCLYDPVAGIGGMNHFLLPGSEPSAEAACSRYGTHAMELLVQGMLARGAKRARLMAKLFGGARVVTGLADLGARNAEFAERYVRAESLTLVGASLRGDRGRRVEFWPHSGRTRQLFVGAIAWDSIDGPATDAALPELC